MAAHPTCDSEGCLPCLLRSVRLSKRKRMSEARKELQRATRLWRALQLHRKDRNFRAARRLLGLVRESGHFIAQHMHPG